MRWRGEWTSHKANLRQKKLQHNNSENYKYPGRKTNLGYFYLKGNKIYTIKLFLRFSMIIPIYSSAPCMPKYVYQEWKEKTWLKNNHRASGLFASLDDLFVQRVPESAMRFVFSDVYNRQRREHNHMCYPKKSCIVGCAGQLPKKFTPSGSISSCCWCAYNLLQALESFIQKEKLQRRHCCRLGYERPQMDLTCKLRNWNQRVFHAPLNRSATTACWSSSSPCS